MAAAGYMTEVDVESIWDTALDTTRFGKINVRMGEFLNFYITGDASTDIADATVLPMLEHISEEALVRLMMAAKANAVTDPWLFIQANVSSVIKQVMEDNEALLKMIKDKLYNRVELVTRELPRTTDSNVIP
jgi:hypothetical protein